MSSGPALPAASLPATTFPATIFPAPMAMIGFVVGAAFAAGVAPLATYAISLGAFGLVHVLAEVRYVDERFRLRLGQGLVVGLLGLLFVIVGWRIWLVLGGTAGAMTPSIELVLVSLLAVTALVAVRPAGLIPALVAGGVVALLALGAYAAPLTALVLLAVLHNLTPVGFLAERLRGGQRRRALIASALAFVVVPVGIGSGLLRSAWQSVGLPVAGGSFWRVGAVEDHLGVFVPPGLTDSGGAIDLFAAVVYLQVLHYAVVIHVLPRLGASEPSSEAGPPTPSIRATGAWPARSVFAALLGVVAAVSLVGFALSFQEARKVYGIFAAFHAWLEVPILLLALGGGAVLRERITT